MGCERCSGERDYKAAVEAAERGDHELLLRIGFPGLSETVRRGYVSPEQRALQDEEERLLGQNYLSAAQARRLNAVRTQLDTMMKERNT